WQHPRRFVVCHHPGVHHKLRREPEQRERGILRKEIIPGLPQELILLLRVGGGDKLFVLLVDQGTLKKMRHALAVVHKAHDDTILKAPGGVGPRQTMELLLQEPLTPPDELALFELDVYADLPPVGGNHFAHMHELRQFGAWCQYISRFETMRITGLG